MEKAQPLIALVDKAVAESLAHARRDNLAKATRIKPADRPYQMVVTEGGRPTENVSFRFGMIAKITRTQTGQTSFNRPDLFDSKGTPLHPTTLSIGDGSTVRVAFEIYPFYIAIIGAGVSLRLRAIQVLNLVERPGRDAKSYGFSEEEGYVRDAPPGG